MVGVIFEKEMFLFPGDKNIFGWHALKMVLDVKKQKREGVIDKIIG